MSNFSIKKQGAKTLAEFLNEKGHTSSVDDNGIFSTKQGAYEAGLEHRGLTLETAEKVHEFDRDFSIATLAINAQPAADYFNGLDKEEREGRDLSISVPMGGDSINHRYYANGEITSIHEQKLDEDGTVNDIMKDFKDQFDNN